MKNTLLSFALLLTFLTFTSNLQAQTRFGIKGGLNFANLDIENNNDNKEALLSPQVGIVVYSGLDKPVFFQTGLLYNQKGRKQTEQGVESKLMYNYLELPVNVGFQIPVGSFSISPYVGAFAGYAISGKAKVGGLSFDIFDTDLGNIGDEEYDSKRFDYGGNIGVGLHFNNRFIVSGQYSHGLGNLGSDNYKINTRTATLGLTFLF